MLDCCSDAKNIIYQCIKLSGDGFFYVYFYTLKTNSSCYRQYKTCEPVIQLIIEGCRGFHFHELNLASGGKSAIHIGYITE